MGTVSCCDRCRSTGVILTLALGRELCDSCVEDFRAWVDAGRPGPALKRGDWGRALERLAWSLGEITAEDVAQHFGVPRSKAHWQCNYHTRETGALVRKAFGRYAAARPRPEAG